MLLFFNFKPEILYIIMFKWVILRIYFNNKKKEGKTRKSRGEKQGKE